MQLAQALVGQLVGRGIGRHPGAEALAEPQMGVVQLEQAGLGVQVPLGQVFRAGDLMPLPQLGELRRCLGQPRYQAFPRMPIARRAAEVTLRWDGDKPCGRRMPGPYSR
jgi:hypothetical protein